MSLSPIFDQFQRESGGAHTSAVRQWGCALRMRLTRRVAGKRRPSGFDSRQLESLEVRQVLSVANPGLPAVDVIVSTSDVQHPVDGGPLHIVGNCLSDSSRARSPDESAAFSRARLTRAIGNDAPQFTLTESGSFDSSISDGAAAGSDRAWSVGQNPSFSDSNPATSAPATASKDHPAGLSVSVDFSVALIDEVFRNSQSLLGDSSMPRAATFPSVAGNLCLASNPANDPVRALAGSSEASGSSPGLLARQTLFIHHSVDSLSDQFANAGNLATNEGFGRLFFPDSLLTAPAESDIGVLSDRLSGPVAGESESDASATPVEFPAVRSHWLMWLTEDTSGSRVSPQESDFKSPLGEHLIGKTVLLLSEDSRPRQAHQATSSQVQTQSRKLRENHRQTFVREQVESTAPDEFELPQSLEAGSIPRQLKFFVDPRGPPVYGRDADVPFPETNAPADLLERLRYSIAPRGPSLVTVEMQSPEHLSFSGPRISPKEL